MEIGKKKILLTGATGFVGQHLLDEIEDCNLNIRILTRQSNPKFWCKSSYVEIVQGDLSDKKSLNRAFEGVEIVINLAAELENSEYYDSTNVTGTKNIVEFAKKYNIKKIIHLSSVGVVGKQYSGKSIIIDEKIECSPKNGYEITKLKSERLLIAGLKLSSVYLIILRPTNIFGENHARNKLLNYFRYISANRWIVFEKDAIVNYIYVKDLVEIIRYFIFNKNDCGIFNVGKSIRLSELIDYCSKILNAAPIKVIFPSFVFRALELLNYFGKNKIKPMLRSLSSKVEYSDEKIMKLTSYKYGIIKGLLNTINNYISKDKL